MGDGRLNRAIEQGKARTSEIKARVPDLKDRMPEFKERMPDLKDRVPELKERGAELRARGGELARQYSKMDVSWARCGYARALREGLLAVRPRPDDRLLPAPPRGRARGVRRAEPARDLRRQPLQPPRHADDPARDPAQVAQPHRGGGRRRLLLQEPLEGERRRAAVQHRAARPQRRRARQRRHRPRRQAHRPGLEPADVPRGHALARRRDRQGALGRGGDRGAARHRHRPDLRQRHPRGDAARAELAEAQAGPDLLAPPQGRGALRRADRPARRVRAPRGDGRGARVLGAQGSPGGRHGRADGARRAADAQGAARLRGSRPAKRPRCASSTRCRRPRSPPPGTPPPPPD